MVYFFPAIEWLCDELDEFTCKNGTCIEVTRHCDGVVDCDDESDEFDCPTTMPPTIETTATTTTTSTTTTVFTTTITTITTTTTTTTPTPTTMATVDNLEPTTTESLFEFESEYDYEEETISTASATSTTTTSTTPTTTTSTSTTAEPEEEEDEENANGNGNGQVDETGATPKSKDEFSYNGEYDDVIKNGDEEDPDYYEAEWLRKR